MARKTREESENTKVLILKSALDCFYEKGFSRTTFEDIALRIHLTKGAVYWHFKNKAELLAELIRQRVAKDREEIGSQYISSAFRRRTQGIFPARGGTHRKKS